MSKPKNQNQKQPPYIEEVKKIADALHGKFGSLETAVNAYKAKNDEIVNAQKKLAGLTNGKSKSARRRANRALTKYDSNKEGFKTELNGKPLTASLADDIMKKHNITGVNYVLFRQLVALDDWSTIAGYATDLIREHGPSVINWLWNKFVGKTETSMEPEINLSNYAKPGFGSVQKFTPVSGVSLQMPGIVASGSYASKSYHLDAVSKSFLKCFFAPEKYIFRRPSDKASKTALFNGNGTFNLQTDASGNVGCWIFPQQPFATSGPPNAFQSFAFQSNVGFVPSTGAYASTLSFPGPLNGSTANGQSWRVNSVKVVVTPIISMNNSAGNMQLTYFQDPLNDTMGKNGINPQLPQQTLPLTPYYQAGNMLATYSSLRLPTDDHDDDFFPDNQNTSIFDDGTPSNDEGFYILITGGTPSTQVAKVDYYLNGEFYPNQANLPLSVMDTSEPGPVTTKCIATLALRSPRIQTCSLKEAEYLCQVIDQTAGKFNDVIDAICMKAATFESVPTGATYSQSYPQVSSMYSLD